MATERFPCRKCAPPAGCIYCEGTRFVTREVRTARKPGIDVEGIERDMREHPENWYSPEEYEARLRLMFGGAFRGPPTNAEPHNKAGWIIHPDGTKSRSKGG